MLKKKQKKNMTASVSMERDAHLIQGGHQEDPDLFPLKDSSIILH